MNLERKFVIFMAVFIVVSFAYIFLKDAGNNTVIMSEAAAEKNQKQIIAQSYSPITTGSLGPGDAVVELTPRRIDGNTFEVKFSINTHSVSLSGFDMMQIAVLEHEEHVFKPAKASRVGGHHSAGVIVFNVEGRIGTKDNFKIRLQGIPKIQDRVYEWDEV
jgi:hypothetical protein